MGRRTGRTRQDGVEQVVDLGMAELRPDPQRPTGVTLLVDGVPQSYVDRTDPTYLHFDYVRRIASVVDAVAPAGAPLRVLHLGGGALTLPRYVAATRPGSAQLVVERDAALVELVGRTLPLPAGHDVRIRVGHARDVVDWSADGPFDLVVGDVYRGARLAGGVGTASFATGLRRILAPDGVYTLNVTDLPPLVLSRVQAATLRAAYGDVCVVAARTMLRGRRYGNVVLAAAAAAGRLPVDRLVRAALRDPVPGIVLHGPSLDDFTAHTHPSPD
ncbi:spermidine synthase [Polymorphospora lycopeni]|uniref:Fused MFS/spermidine synthase n=1 Tax=Polymorphospora lycopeni TaxID=3140240 RepID=A0ABV5CS86_9ACTN